MVKKSTNEPPPLISFDDDGDEWQDMPVVRTEDPNLVLDEEDQKKFHYVAPTKPATGATVYGNATGNLIDFDEKGQEWRSKLDGDEGDYTRLRLDEDQDNDEVHLRTKYLFDEDKAMTPVSQMQATKDLLTESQRIAYVGLCALATREMVMALKAIGTKEVQPAIQSMELWALKIMGRLYHHMELESAEQKMIESLGEHGVKASDLAPALITTHTVRNPDYDPAAALKKSLVDEEESLDEPEPSSGHLPTEPSPFADEFGDFANYEAPPPFSSLPPAPIDTQFSSEAQEVLTPRPGDTLFGNVQPVLPGSSPQPSQLQSVSTSLSSTDENVTLDIRWTVLCDLFLILIADSVYDSRSRVLLETAALKLGLGWVDVVRFEKRVTDALEIEENVDGNLDQTEVIAGRRKAARKRRYVMMGLATLGGGLVIGLSAGLLAPVIGAGLGAAFATVGVTGTSAFLGGTAGAAVITTGGVLTGSGVAAKGMARRTRNVGTFALLPLHNNKRVNCIITVPGFMSSVQDDVRLPFSVLDPIVGDVFSVFWEPEMMQETGNALKILTTEVLTQVGQTVLQATVMTGLMSALTWPLVLTKLGYLIDNPWSNALDRASAAGLVLADILRKRALGVRPITLIGFSLGARVIFYALVELAKQRAMGIVQDVILLGATVTASTKTWHSVRGVVAGRMVNGYARNDWVLNYLFRASVGGLYTVAGLRPIPDVPGLENVDVTDKISGHASYRVYMPVILHQLGFPVSADYFDEPEELEMEEDRIVMREEPEPKKKKFSFFGRKKKDGTTTPKSTPSASNPWAEAKGAADADDLPERLDHNAASTSSLPVSPPPKSSAEITPPEAAGGAATQPGDSTPSLPLRAGFDFKAINRVIESEDAGADMPAPIAQLPRLEGRSFNLERSGSAPPPIDSIPLSLAEPARASQHNLADSVAPIIPRFERSVSMQPIRPRSPPPVKDAEESIPSPPNGMSNPASTFSPVPSFDYDGGNDSVWSRPQASFTDFEPPAGISFGGADGSISFAPPPQSSAFDSETVSFGSADGNISYTSPIERDPWAVPPIPTKSKKIDVAGNPWG